jgi:3-methyladenine DNA glycosylase Tag
MLPRRPLRPIPGLLDRLLSEVSKVRLNQTLNAEFPQFKQYVMKLRGGKTEHSVASLAEIWGIDTAPAGEIADQLVEVGFFERRGTVNKPDYWVPFLYRVALDMIRGAAD